MPFRRSPAAAAQRSVPSRGHVSVRPRRRTVCTALAAACVVAAAAASEETEQRIEVTVTAYNSVPEQTNEQPTIAAWGDELEPGMKVIAVSRDLLDMGLERGTVVRIEGLPGEYVVLDKMHWRWQRRIDVYMGEDVAAARRFGRQRRMLSWEGADDAPELEQLDEQERATGPPPPEVGAAAAAAPADDSVDAQPVGVLEARAE